MASSRYGVGTRNSAFDMEEVDDGDFNYHERVEVETSQKVGKDQWIRSIGGVVNQEGPFTFVIEPQVDRYVQLNKAEVEMVVAVEKKVGDGKCKIHDDVVAPVNLLGAVFWDQVEVTLNGKPFSGASSSSSGLKAYIETLLSYDTDARNTHLQSQLCYLDTPGQFDNFNLSEKTMRGCFMKGIKDGHFPRPDIPAEFGRAPTDQQGNILPGHDDVDGIMMPDIDLDRFNDDVPEEKLNRARRRKVYQEYFYKELWSKGANDPTLGTSYNKGFDSRAQIASGSEQFDMYSPITHDFFRISNMLAPGNRVEIRLNRAKDPFLLCSYRGRLQQYWIHIIEMRLHFHTIERKETIPLPLQETYLMNETQMHKHLVAANSPSTTIRIHSGGVMPKNIIVAMNTTTAIDGSYDRNPFNFHHFHTKKMYLTINGEVHPSNGLEFDFTSVNHLTARSYYWIYDNTGASDAQQGNSISKAAFEAGSFIIPFDLTPDRCNGLHNHDAQVGYIDLNIEFSFPLSESIYVLTEMVFPKVVVNDKASGTLAVLDIESGRERI